jgi:hypothetical protein
MKIDFSQELQTIRGETLTERVVTDPNNPEGELEVVTLGGCAVGALLMPEQGVQGKEKAKRYALAIKIQESDGDLELGVSQVALIKKMIGKHLGALVVGQCWAMLDPADPEED